MPAIGAEFKGKAKAPSFYKPAAPAPVTQPKESHWPILVGGALAGAAILLLIRGRSSGGTTGTGSVLTVYPSGMADSSQITNMQGTVQAMLNNPNTGQTVSTSPPTDSQGNVVSSVSESGLTHTPKPLVISPNASQSAVGTPFQYYADQPKVGDFAGTGTFYGAPLGAPSGTISTADANAMYARLVAYANTLPANTPNANKALGLGFSPSAPESNMTVSEYLKNELGQTWGQPSTIDISKG